MRRRWSEKLIKHALEANFSWMILTAHNKKDFYLHTSRSFTNNFVACLFMRLIVAITQKKMFF